MKNKGQFKSNFLSIFDNTLKITWIAVVIVITNFAIIVKKINQFNLNFNINLLLIITLVIFIIIVFAFYFINWNISRFEITDEVLIVYKNIFVKDRKEILIKNIANMGLSKNIFERIFKLIRIKIYANEKNKLFCDFEVILTKRNFYKYINPFMKKLKFDIEDKRGDNSIEFKFTDILKHSFLSIPISSIIVIINFILLIFNMIGNGTLLKDIMYDFLGLLITLVGFIFPVIYSILKNVLIYINFSIQRKGDVIYLSYGLCTFKEYIIPVNKINGIIIDSSILPRLFRNYKLNIINAGIGDRKNELEILFPISRKNRCKDVINLILPEYAISMNYRIQPFEAVIIIAIKVIILMLLLVIPFIYININIALAISLILFLTIFFIYFIKRIIISDKYICVINGIFIKRVRIINYKKIENIEIKEGIVSRKFGLYKIYIYILSGLKNSRISTGYIKKKELSTIYNNIPLDM